jgi:uncharacterized phage protein (TIGR01671 family)
MSRKIDFRVWNKTLKEMLLVVGSIEMHNSKIVRITAGKTNNWLKDGWFDIKDDGIDKIELMQFTGLLDCHGKEIYEEDICRGSGWPDEEANQIGIVKYIGMGFKVKNMNNQYRGGEIYLGFNLEVIGNVFMNPELLNK